MHAYICDLTYCTHNLIDQEQMEVSGASCAAVKARTQQEIASMLRSSGLGDVHLWRLARLGQSQNSGGDAGNANGGVDTKVDFRHCALVLYRLVECVHLLFREQWSVSKGVVLDAPCLASMMLDHGKDQELTTAETGCFFTAVLPRGFLSSFFFAFLSIFLAVIFCLCCDILHSWRCISDAFSVDLSFIASLFIFRHLAILAYFFVVLALSRLDVGYLVISCCRFHMYRHPCFCQRDY
jgi:hypothetical protein